MARKGSATISRIAKHEPQVREKPAPEEASVPQCRHYWLLEFPSGPTSRAVCKLCGATRVFPNATDDYIHEGEVSATWKPSRYQDDEA